MTQLLAIFLLAGWAWASDSGEVPAWNQYRGPHRDGISTESNWNAKWPKEGPAILWKAEVGKAQCGFAACTGKLITCGNVEGNEKVYCFDPASGKELWNFGYESGPKTAKNAGPAATPALDEHSVYVLSRTGQLHVLDLASGAVRWKKDFVAEYGARNPPNGFCGSPLLYEGKVIVPTCGKQATVAAFDVMDGKEVWAWKGSNSNYASPLPTTVGDTVQFVVGNDAGFNGIDENGTTVWGYAWSTAYKINATIPVRAGDKLFVSSGYRKGCALLKPAADKIEEIWGGNKKELKSMHNQFSPCVLWEDHLYGYDGDGQGGARQPLVCINVADGQVKWSSQDMAGAGGLMIAGDKLVILNHKGTLAIAEIHPEAYRELGRAQAVGNTCWQPPLLHDGRIFCRNEDGQVVCLDVKLP